MSGVIYLVQGEGTLVPMTEQAYDSEGILQSLLADYPDLLGGEQMTTSAPRRWLLLAREAGLPSTEDGVDRWSIDHLFIDQDGIPTIIEVKRSSDTRIRREVVGQMLDYAANAVAYWPVESLRSRFEQRCDAEGGDPEITIADALGFEGDIEDLWKQVQTNLQAGRVRLVFVADVIPPELRRVVEFLNGQMNPAEVLAVEVRQYVGQGQQALVPRVLGQTQQAAGQKSAGGLKAPSRPWDKASFMAELEQRCDPQARITAERIQDHLQRVGIGVTFTRRDSKGSMFPLANFNKRSVRLFTIYSDGKVEVPFGEFAKVPMFHDDSTRRVLLDKFNNLDDVDIDQARIAAWPAIPLSVLARGQNLDKFLAIATDMFERIRSVDRISES